MSDRPASNDRLVPFSSKLAFGVGQYAEGLKNTAFSLFILFYYNQVLGLSGTLAGMALFIALLFDAVTDPLAGSLSDNWKSKARPQTSIYVCICCTAGDRVCWALFTTGGNGQFDYSSG